MRRFWPFLPFLIALVLVGLGIWWSLSGPEKPVNVSGYTTKDGKIVQPYKRR